MSKANETLKAMWKAEKQVVVSDDGQTTINHPSLKAFARRMQETTLLAAAWLSRKKQG